MKQHFKDRHSKKWVRFSIFFTENEDHIYALEDALISIVNPKGNSKQPLRIDNEMKKRIDKAIKKIDDENRKRIVKGNKTSEKEKKL